jgi:hypothetical protein
MKFLLFLLFALPLFGKQSERYYQEKFAREIGGQVEVVMKDGTRCDILTATHAIEVDFARKWAEADWTEFKLRDAHGEKTGCCSDRTVSIRLQIC